MVGPSYLPAGSCKNTYSFHFRLDKASVTYSFFHFGGAKELTEEELRGQKR